MHKRYSTILLPLVLLLFVGSSGCTTSDILDVMEVLGGSQGITTADVLQREAPKAFGGGTTGDKEKDELLEVGDAMRNVQKAGELEDEANEALAEDPPDLATAAAKLEEAIAVRPNDWSLKNQLNALETEQGQDTSGTLLTPYQICKFDLEAMTPRGRRCWKSIVGDRARAAQRSVDRQKKGEGLVKCATYEAVVNAYSWVARLTPADAMMKMGYRADQYDGVVDRYEEAKNLVAHPGQSCAK